MFSCSIAGMLLLGAPFVFNVPLGGTNLTIHTFCAPFPLFLIGPLEVDWNMCHNLYILYTAYGLNDQLWLIMMPLWPSGYGVQTWSLQHGSLNHHDAVNTFKKVLLATVRSFFNIRVDIICNLLQCLFLHDPCQFHNYGFLTPPCPLCNVKAIRSHHWCIEMTHPVLHPMLQWKWQAVRGHA